MKAIHNAVYPFCTNPVVVQNIKDTNFWKQFTTLISSYSLTCQLFRISKIQTFESNSQPIALYRTDNWVVQNIKDTNFWKQFTTSNALHTCCVTLFRISKIQTFESNSQRNILVDLILFVVQNIKDTNFWKQFTTTFYTLATSYGLFRISKIQTFESNSQLTYDVYFPVLCCSEYQRYKLLKAIHNTPEKDVKGKDVVQNIKDTNFWKQFTTNIKFLCTNFGCSEYQRYKLLKAIHNSFLNSTSLLIVVQNIKDTNFWKQFTTITFITYFLKLLFRISKIQTFESNSQRYADNKKRKLGCSEYQRYKLLKAIHNDIVMFSIVFIVVQNIKDTNFWKQFTTWNGTSKYQTVLFRISKIQTFESNSQLLIELVSI